MGIANFKEATKKPVLSAWFVFVGVSVGILGCGPAVPTGAPVKGRATVEGKPLPNGAVVFRPDAEKGNTIEQEFRGNIDGENSGAYELQTDENGVPFGWYRVVVFAIESPNRMVRPVWLIDRKYGKVETSGLSVEVVESPADGAYDFDLER